MDYNYSFDNPDSNYGELLKEARKREKKGLFSACSKLGILLLLYNFMQTIFVYVYYLEVYAVFNHRITLNVNTALVYLRSNTALTSSSSFSMAGNILVVVPNVIFTLWVARYLMKIDLSEMMKPKKGQVTQAVKWFPACLTLNVTASILISIVSAYFSEKGITIPDADLSISHPSTTALVLQFSYVIIIGPIVEELIYRGVILTLLKPYGKFMAVFFSALIFGLMHGNIPQAVSAFAGAIIFGLVAVHCNSIVPTIIIHIANNTVASFTDFSDALGWKYGDRIYVFLELSIFLIGIFMLVVQWKKLRLKNDNRYAMTSSQRYMTVLTNIFMLVYFAYQLFNIVITVISANTN